MRWLAPALLLALPASVQAAASKTWLFNGTLESWTHSNCPIVVRSQYVKADPGVTDPQLISPTNIQFDPDANCANGTYMRIGIKNFGSNQTAQFFFANNNHGFSASHTTTFTVPNDQNWHWITVVLANSDCPGASGVGDLHTGGRVNQIRIDPVQTGSSAASDSFLVDFIALRQDNAVPYAPSVALSTPEYTWTNVPFTFTASGTDPPPYQFDGSGNPDQFASGILRFEWRLGLSGSFNLLSVQSENQQTGVSTSTFSIPVGSLNQGDNLLLVRSRDRCTAIGPPTGYLHLYYDSVAPTAPGTPAVYPGPVSPSSSFSFDWDPSVEQTSGIARYEIQLDHGPIYTAPGEYFDGLSVGTGPHTVRARAIDNANNIGPWSADVGFYYDPTAPTAPSSLVVSPNGYSTDDSYSVSWVAGADAQSGVAGYRLRVDGEDFADIAGSPYVGDLASGVEGQHSLEVRTVDFAGNLSPPDAATFYYYPRWIEPAADLVPSQDSLALPQTVGWNGYYGLHYVTQVAADATFQTGVDSVASDANWVQLPRSLAPVTNGDYYWRVRTVESFPQNWSAARHFVAIDPPPPPLQQTVSVEFPSGDDGEGVNTSLGAVTRTLPILTVHGPVGDLPITATYSSVSTTNGLLGNRWNWTLGQRLQLAPGVSAVASLEDNAEFRFKWSGTDFAPDLGVYDSLLAVGGGEWEMVRPSKTRLRFDASGALTRIADRSGNALQIAYASPGQPASFTDPGGRLYAMDAASGKLARIQDALGRQWNFEYDGAGNLSAFVDPRSGRTTFEYDVAGRLTRVVDPLGHNVMRYGYDGQGRVTTQTDALDSVTTFTYDDANHRTLITDPHGGVRIHVRDASSRLVKEFDERGNSTEYTYDAQHNRTAVKDARGFVTSYEYDTRGNVTKVTDPLGAVTRTVFDLTNSPVERFDALNNHTTWTNDPLGRPTRMEEPGPRVTLWEYNAAGQVVHMTDPNNNVTTNGFNAAGDLVSTVNGAGDEVTFTYDGVGRRLTSKDELLHTTAFAYDELDSLTTRTDPTGAVTGFEYDADGNRTAAVDPLLRRTTYAYDAKDRLVMTTDALGNVTRSEYDALDRRVRTVDARGQINESFYDAVGNLVLERDPLGHKVQSTYDQNRNRTSTTDARGKTTTFEYDAANRVTKTVDPLGHETNQIYDLMGRVLSSRNARNFSTAFEYDGLGRLAAVTSPRAGILRYAYDAVGNRTSVTDALNRIRSYTYDAANRLANTSDALGNTETYGYDVAGNRVSRLDANGHTTTYTYDEVHRPLVTHYADNTTVSRTYDLAGNMTSMTDRWGTATYVYDALSRLKQSTDDFGKLLSFAYDSSGNMTSQTNPGGRVVAYGYDAANRLVHVNDGHGHGTQQFPDAAGSDSVVVYPNGVRGTSVLDDAGRLVSLATTSPNGDTLVAVTYELDENGNRTRTVRIDRRRDSIARAGGINVYETSVELEKAQFPTGADTVVIGSGDDWAEAISAGSLARRLGAPLLLVAGDDLNASPAARMEIVRLKTVRPDIGAILVGDIGSLSAVVEAQLEGMGISARRIVGLERSDVARRATGTAPVSSAILIGTRDVSNAAAAALMAGERRQPLLFSDAEVVPQPTQQALGSVGATSTVLIGGSDAIGAGAEAWLGAHGHVPAARYAQSDPARLFGAAHDDLPADEGLGRRARLVRGDLWQDALVIGSLPDAGQGAELLVSGTGLAASPDASRWLGRHKGHELTVEVVGNGAAPPIATAMESEIRNGLRMTVTEYTYDGLDELVREMIPGVDTTDYVYDLSGNRTSTTRRGHASPYTYDLAGRLTSADTATFSYDGSGNRIARTTPHTSASYTYDDENRLVQVVTAQGTSDYRYDGIGRRLRAAEPGGQVRRYVIDPTSRPYRTSLEMTDAGVATSEFTHGSGLLSEERPANGIRYFHYDGLGSTAAITDGAGTDVGHLGYEAFGDTLLDLGSTDTRFGWVGKYGVESTPSGLVFMRDRFYDPETGMFVSQDPEAGGDRDFLMATVYGYAGNNPVESTDPDGRKKQSQPKAQNKGPSKLGRVISVGGRLGAEFLNTISDPNTYLSITQSPGFRVGVAATKLFSAVPSLSGAPSAKDFSAIGKNSLWTKTFAPGAGKLLNPLVAIGSSLDLVDRTSAAHFHRPETAGLLEMLTDSRANVPTKSSPLYFMPPRRRLPWDPQPRGGGSAW